LASWFTSMAASTFPVKTVDGLGGLGALGARDPALGRRSPLAHASRSRRRRVRMSELATRPSFEEVALAISAYESSSSRRPQTRAS
jgi:hypothetical protein